MHLVILDGHTLKPRRSFLAGDRKARRVTYFDRTPADQVAERLKDADAALTNKVPVSAEVFAACPKLKYVGVTATGYNIIDLAGAKKAGAT